MATISNRLLTPIDPGALLAKRHHIRERLHAVVTHRLARDGSHVAEAQRLLGTLPGRSLSKVGTEARSKGRSALNPRHPEHLQCEKTSPSSDEIGRPRPWRRKPEPCNQTRFRLPGIDCPSTSMVTAAIKRCVCGCECRDAISAQRWAVVVVLYIYKVDMTNMLSTYNNNICFDSGSWYGRQQIPTTLERLGVLH